MGETVDALVVGTILFKPETMDPGSEVEVFRPLYALCSMIGTRHIQMKLQSKLS
jgi:hypothetical protein